MSMTFTKLFSSITESSVWFEPNHVRLAWITMLAMADRKGRVFASIPGLAHRARIEIPEAVQAIERFLSPDEYSRTKSYDGRRIEVIDGGWRLLNYLKFRAIRDEEAYKESKREYASKRREVENISKVEQGGNSASASASVSASSVSEGIGEGEVQKGAGEGGLQGNSGAGLSQQMAATEILTFLNQAAGRKFRFIPENLSLVQRRLKEVNYDVEGVKKMITRKVECWKGTAMEEYLRPATLFGKEKFAGYYDDRDIPASHPTQAQVPPNVQLKALDDAIANHVANSSSPKFDSQCSMEMRNALTMLREKRTALIQRITQDP